MDKNKFEQLAHQIQQEVGGQIYKFEIPKGKYKTAEFDKKATQAKITDVVSIYLREFPKQSEEFFKQVAQDRNLQFDKFGRPAGDTGKAMDTGVEFRMLYELPELLANMIYNSLDLNQRNWFTSKEGGRWFAKTFPKFTTSVV